MNRNGVKTGNWTEDEKQKLDKMVEKDINVSEIAKKLNRTYQAVVTRKTMRKDKTLEV